MNFTVVTRWKDLLSVGIDPERALPGTKKGHCSRCQEEVALAPASQDFMRMVGEAAIICHACLTPEDQEKTRPLPLTNEVLRDALKVSLWRKRHLQ